jgi:2-hydroxychromene-2-carboxylate isomerase
LLSSSTTSDIAAEPNVLEIDCYYSLSSPWAYLAGPRLQDIVRRLQTSP